MKRINADKTMLFTLMILTLSVGLSSATSVYAMNSPNTQPNPGLIPPGSTFDLTWMGDPNTDPHDVRVIRVHEPFIPNMAEGNTDAASNGIGDCIDQIDKAAAGEARMWELRHTDNSQPIQFSDIDAGEMISVKFGVSGANVNIVADAGVTISSATGKWVQITPGEVDVDFVDITGNWKMESCGTDFGGSGSWANEDGILVEEPVGGEILSINTSALLIAGFASSGIWMIPAFGAIAGTGVALYKLRRN